MRLILFIVALFLAGCGTTVGDAVRDSIPDVSYTPAGRAAAKAEIILCGVDTTVGAFAGGVPTAVRLGSACVIRAGLRHALIEGRPICPRGPTPPAVRVIEAPPPADAHPQPAAEPIGEAREGPLIRGESATMTGENSTETERAG